jgi:ribonuclease H / adenosylcobalamin/alpha-ribazole phosphatase
MSLFYLIRHGEHDWLKRGIAGRLSAVHLNANGREQAAELAVRLKGTKFDGVFSSPMERAVETAEPLVKETGIELQIAPAITELDFGEWNGRTFEELSVDERWAKWNHERTMYRMPGGELMSEVQGRVVGFLMGLHQGNCDGIFALFSHGDAIRAALCYWLGMPMDLLPRLHVDTASVTILKLDEGGPQIVVVNHRGALQSLPV